MSDAIRYFTLVSPSNHAALEGFKARGVVVDSAFERREFDFKFGNVTVTIVVGGFDIAQKQRKTNKCRLSNLLMLYCVWN